MRADKDRPLVAAPDGEGQLGVRCRVLPEKSGE